MPEPLELTTPVDRVSASHPPAADGVACEPAEPRAAMSERVRALRLDKGRLLRRPRRRWRWLFLALLALVGGLGYAYRKRLDASRLLTATPELPAVTVVEEPPVPLVLNTTGYIIAHAIVHVGSRVPGTVIELNFAEGDMVQKGQLLARLDDQQYLAELNQAKAALAAAEAQLAEQRNGAREQDVLKAKAALVQAEAHREQMDEEYNRAKQLQGTISKTEFSRAKTAFLEAQAAAEQATHSLRIVELGARPERIAALEADVKSAQALVDKAQYYYDGTKITAPVDGKVVERNIEVGETLRSENLGSSFCRIADFSHLEAEIDIPERDLAAIRLEQPCRIRTEAYPDHTYPGRLSWLAPVFNRQRAIRRAKIAILVPDDKLAPDMNCQVQILAEEPPPDKEKVIRLPAAVLRRDGGQTFLYVVEKDTAHRRPVEVTELSQDKVEVTHGLTSGEVVLLPGETPLEDGQSVRVRLLAPEQSG